MNAGERARPYLLWLACAGLAAILALLFWPGNPPAAPPATGDVEHPVVLPPTLGGSAKPPRLEALPPLEAVVLRATYALNGPNQDYERASRVVAGRTYRVLESRGGWLRLRLGQTDGGWIPGYRARLQTRAPVSASVAPGRWDISFDGGPQVSVVSGPTGLEVRLSGDAWGAPAARNVHELRVPWTGAPLPAFALDVLERELRRVSLERDELVLHLWQEADLSVRPGTSDKPGWNIQFRSTLRRVTVAQTTDRKVYRIVTSGFVDPRASLRDGRVRLDLGRMMWGVGGASMDAGASSPAAGLADLPPGVSLSVSGKGTVLEFPHETGRYVLRRAPGVIALEMLSPGIAGKRIAIDPGHGGEEPGATSRLGQTEKEVNLAVALRLRDVLRAMGAEVDLTRDRDERMDVAGLEGLQPPGAVLPDGVEPTWKERLAMDLAARVAKVNDASADVFVSIHANYDPSPKVSGTVTYVTGYHADFEQSRILGSLLQAELVRALGRRDRGVWRDQFYVLKYAQAPAALVEMMFLSNPEEAALLREPETWDAAARAIARALESYFGHPAGEGTR